MAAVIYYVDVKYDWESDLIMRKHNGMKMIGSEKIAKW